MAEACHFGRPGQATGKDGVSVAEKPPEFKRSWGEVEACGRVRVHEESPGEATGKSLLKEHWSWPEPKNNPCAMNGRQRSGVARPHGAQRLVCESGYGAFLISD